MLTIPTLDSWALFHDCLLGEAINHPNFENGQRVKTNKIIKLDKKIGMVMCVANEYWQLGRPSTLAKYIDPKTKRFY